MERILVIGCPGSGKTRLAKYLGEQLNLPVTHLDRLWWTGEWETVSLETFDDQLQQTLAGKRWIIDGNYSRTMTQRLQRCDTIIYLDYSRWQCLAGMAQRILENRGRSRPDMGGTCPERLDPEFIKFIWNFNKRNRNLNYTWIAQAKHARAVILKNRKEAAAFAKSLTGTAGER